MIMSVAVQCSAPGCSKLQPKHSGWQFCFPVLALNIFLTGMTSIRWRKWITDTGQITTVTGHMHSQPCYYQCQSCTSKHPVPFPVWNTHHSVTVYLYQSHMTTTFNRHKMQMLTTIACISVLLHVLTTDPTILISSCCLWGAGDRCRHHHKHAAQCNALRHSKL